MRNQGGTDILDVPHAVKKWADWSEEGWRNESPERRRRIREMWESVEEVVTALQKLGWEMVAENYYQGTQYVDFKKGDYAVRLEIGDITDGLDP
ncbi:hypothetical protein AKJ44_02245 [candidate division MSBL1 archaeon SCGC-AAA261F17]|uniref:Uncharacterized protein n=1 Tax=candidate division MSBL1 archaeon SCGC-AAA261F17 TaxID=1698274 RepID=A0A133V5E4_9EURY|nr:hypothetical protein AKJ44_02245 [candidate division MSBL1 archaeon SCGC-AAA261F17]